MHGPEESDSVVVAGKPTNKAARSAAEPVEPRVGTKGNADQQSTRRAQDRASVSQALERVRQAARQRKKERFTSLLHHVDPAMSMHGPEESDSVIVARKPTNKYGCKDAGVPSFLIE